MSVVRCFLNEAGCFCGAAGSVNIVNGWEVGLSDGLGFIHEALKLPAVLDRAGAIPSFDTARKNVFYGAPVKVGENRS